MTTRSEPGITWNKIIAVCSAFGIPLVSVLVTCIVWGTKIDAKLTQQNQDLQDVKFDIKDIRADQRSLHQQIDTISMRQHDAQLERNYQFKYLQQKK